ncbi:MAG: nucleotide exchange factor GrpE [Clostridiales bacterium]|nr:nucleotide exchange factor GrpE [Clostridiales bacterium]
MDGKEVPVSEQEKILAEEAAEAAESTAEQDTPPELSEVEQLKEELANMNENYLRQVAEFDNFRKRTAKEKQDTYSYALMKCITEFLPVMDNFERALACETQDTEYQKGIEMIYTQLTEMLKKLGVSEIEAEGKPFDPILHNAVSQKEDDNFGENVVCQVFQKGYQLGDKVIRHAMVVVANP